MLPADSNAQASGHLHSHVHERLHEAMTELLQLNRCSEGGVTLTWQARECSSCSHNPASQLCNHVQ